MSYLILASITLIVVISYNAIAKNESYSKMIDSISPWWNVSINLF
jgi:hypothetical protein